MQIIANALDHAWKLYGQGRFAESMKQAEAALTLQPDSVSALTCLAVARWSDGGDIAQSLSELRRAVELAPGVAAIWHNLATIEASNGEIDSAVAHFERALTLKPDDTQAFYALTQNMRFSAETSLVTHIAALVEGNALTPAARSFAAFGLAKAYDDLGDYRKAAGHLLDANALESRPYDMAGERRSLAELRQLARSKSTSGASGSDSDAPIFIVGMPRSGTTLVESILSRHPDVHAAGEMRDLHEAESRLLGRLRTKGYRGGRNAALQLVDAGDYAALAQSLLGSVAEAAGRPFRRFTDKVPDNAMRLGFVEKLFPRARVIYVRRHPLDTALSNLFIRFTAGHGYSFRQDQLGERYRQVVETMALWKQALDLPILDVSYEKLVTDPEAQSRRIVEFAGLDWDESCLAPQGAARRILTASQFQVRQPIYRSSIGRWRNYHPWLDPLVKAMGGEAWIAAEAEESLRAGD